MDNILVLYHRNCADGFAGAAVLYEFLSPHRKLGETLHFQPIDYGEPVPDIAGKNVYIVDFTFPPEVLIPKLAEAKAVVMFDHHARAIKEWMAVDKANLPTNFVLIHSKDLSGVGLVWDYLYKDQDKPMPYLYEMIQDHDLYIHDITASEEVNLALMNMPMVREGNFEAFLHLAHEEHIAELAINGSVIKRAFTEFIHDAILRTMVLIKFDGMDIPLVPMPRNMRNQAGDILAKVYPFSITYEDDHRAGLRRFSLRSSKHGGFDVSAIATRFGGNGHPSAAGYLAPLLPFTLFPMLEETHEQNTQERLPDQTS